PSLLPHLDQSALDTPSSHLKTHTHTHTQTHTHTHNHTHTHTHTYTHTDTHTHKHKHTHTPQHPKVASPHVLFLLLSPDSLSFPNASDTPDSENPLAIPECSALLRVHARGFFAGEG